MPKTISAADHVRRSVEVPDARRKAVDLLQVLAAVEIAHGVPLLYQLGPGMRPLAVGRYVTQGTDSGAAPNKNH